jgi:hypothetical protein
MRIMVRVFSDAMPILTAAEPKQRAYRNILPNINSDSSVVADKVICVVGFEPVLNRRHCPLQRWRAWGYISRNQFLNPEQRIDHRQQPGRGINWYEDVDISHVRPYIIINSPQVQNVQGGFCELIV